MPEYGASIVMKHASSTPTITPANGFSRGRLVTTRTVNISTKAMTHSAAKATHGPCGPGRVTTWFTDGWASLSPRPSAASVSPATPPANCAQT